MVYGSETQTNKKGNKSYGHLGKENIVGNLWDYKKMELKELKELYTGQWYKNRYKS